MSNEPKICLIDVNNEIADELDKLFSDVYRGSLGPRIELNAGRGDYNLCSLNNRFPANIQEYDIFIIDLTNQLTKEYKFEEQEKHVENEYSVNYLKGPYPSKYFNPRDLSMRILSNSILSIDHQVLVIYVADKCTKTTYFPVIVKSNSHFEDENIVTETYSKAPGIMKCTNQTGEYLNTSDSPGYFKEFFEKHLDGFKYKVKFEDDLIWKEDKHVRDKNFYPLLFGKNGEIVSYLKATKNRTYLVLPPHRNNKSILLPMITEYLPEVRPEIFPLTSQSTFIQSPRYFLPNHQDLLTEKEQSTEDYKKSIKEINTKIEANKSKYGFLHKIVTATSDELVKNLIIFLSWLEFDNVIEVDDLNKPIKEEDIRIEFDQGLIVIEAKGIRGTSKDSDCSQISKIRSRKMEERKKFDVFGLYIVNHQRHLAPSDRINPPFSKEQISDAILEKRGLLTTWQLFLAYEYVAAGLLKKESIRKSLVNHGHIVFHPDGIEIATIDEIHMNNSVFVSNITEKISVGDILVIQRGYEFVKAEVISLMIDDKSVNESSDCVVGVKVSAKIKKGDLVYLKN